MKKAIRITKHQAKNIGSCENCDDSKSDIFQIRIGGVDLRLCPDCLKKLSIIIDKLKENFQEMNITVNSHKTNITVNSHKLSKGQVMTIWVALNSLISSMENGLGDDEIGKKLTQGYKDRAYELINIILENGGDVY